MQIYAFSEFDGAFRHFCDHLCGADDLYALCAKHFAGVWSEYRAHCTSGHSKYRGAGILCVGMHSELHLHEWLFAIWACFLGYYGHGELGRRHLDPGDRKSVV